MCGSFAGFNSDATMQLGLWIMNDAPNRAGAARVAADRGAYGLRDHLFSLIRTSERQGAGAAAWAAAVRSHGGPGSVDWAQLVYALTESEPTGEDVAAARVEAGKRGRRLDDDGAYVWAMRARVHRTLRWVR